MRSNFVLLLSALLIAACLGWGQAQKKSSAKSTAKSSAPKSTAKKSAAKKSTAKKSSARKSTSTRKRTTTARRRTTWRNRQTAPDRERYREIQQALVDKGYLEGPATGRWDQASIDALRRFQEEQNLEPDGKINSLSLIALGLGPKYDTQATPQQP